MKWTTKKEPPAHGDKRARTRFAWAPTELSGNLTVWLEFYLVRELCDVSDFDMEIRWLPLEKVELVYYGY